MLADLRAAGRQLRRAPGFALLVILVLALGIGVNVATFSVVDALLFRPPPGVRDHGRVVELRPEAPRRPGQRVFYNEGYSRAGLEAVRARLGTATRLAAYASASALPEAPALAGSASSPGGGPRRVAVAMVDTAYLPTMGVVPALGTGITSARPGDPAARALVLADAYWRRAFGADPAVIGRVVRLDRQQFTVVGVLSPGFRGHELEPVDAFAPLAAVAAFNARDTAGAWWADPNYTWLSVVARLAPGVAPAAAASAATDALRPIEGTREAAAYRADPAPRTVRAVPLTERFGGVGGEAPVPAWMLGATAAVLLAACANVAGLLLVRAERRQRELATRAALGAPRGRLARAQLAEGLVLGAAGGVLGLALAAGGARLFLVIPGVPALDRLVEGRSAAFAVALTAAAVAAFSLGPVMRAGAADGAALLRSGARTTRRTGALRAALLGVQFASSFALLGVGGLFVRSVRNVGAIDPGYDAARLVRVSVDWQGLGLEPRAADRAFVAAARAVAAHPEVAGVTRGDGGLDGGAMMAHLRVPGRADLARVSGVPGGAFFTDEVGPNYFAATGIPIVRGRGFEAGDAVEPGGVIVNEAFARRVFPGADAVGQCVFLRPDADACTRVVGVARDARFLGLTWRVAPLFYRPRPDTASHPAPLLVRVRPGAPPAAVRGVADAAVAAVRTAEPRATVVQAVVARDRMLGRALAPYRLSAAAFGVFGLLTLGASAVGLYGAVAYAVAQRAGEFGVRAALGARGRDLGRLVLGQGLRAVAAGVVLGAAGAAAGSRLLRARLYGVDPLDPATLAATGLVLAAAALAACWLPARRAAGVDPAAALRAE